MSDANQNGWNEYSRLVLKELETLSDGIANLSDEMQQIRHEITELKAKEDRIIDLGLWKDRVDDVVSPSQLKDLVDDIEDLRSFKTKAVTIFAVIQFLMGAVIFFEKIA